MPHSPAVGRAARFAGVAAAYLLASLLGGAFVVQPEQLAVFWPAGGLLLGYLFVVDRRRWADIALAAFVGNLAANLVFGHSPVVAVGFAAVNAVEPLAIAWAIGRFRDEAFRLDRIADVFWLFAVPFAVCAGTAAVGAGVVTVGLGAPSYWAVWKVWWVADALGAILFAPLVLTWAAPDGDRRAGGPRVLEGGAILALLAAVVWAIFVSDLHQLASPLAMSYPVFPVLLWVSFRTGLRGTSVAVALTSSIVAWGTLQGGGPVGDLAASVTDRVLIAQGFSAVVGLTSLLLATAFRERRAAETALRASEERFRAIFHSQFQFIGLLSPAGVVLDANRGALAAAGVPTAAVLGKPFWDTPWWTHDAAQQDRLRAAIRRAAAGDRDRFEASHPSPAGGLMWVDFSLTPFRDESGRVALLIPEGRDITARKTTEEALAASEERFRSLAGHAPVGIYETDADGNCTFVNARWCAFAGLPATLAAGQGWAGALHPDDRDRVFAEWLAATVGRREFAAEYRFRTPGGEVTWLSGSGVTRYDAGGRVCGFLGTLTDITERTRAEEQVRASLREKEVLLKEIHHRVKNNLQIVSTLLDLQSEHTADAAARVMFEESRGRVRSMALIHERLYRSTDLARVDFAEYIRQLADDLYRTYKVSAADIRLDLAVDVPSLPLDLAIPCGLLLNELMSNCFKHAFPAAAAGCIRVDLRPAADGTNVLTVADDGAGFPAGTDFRNSHSFGLQLVNTLVEQLDGEIALSVAAGTTFTVRFPKAQGSSPDRTPAP